MAHLVVKVIERCENANENANLGESSEKSMFIYTSLHIWNKRASVLPSV